MSVPRNRLRKNRPQVGAELRPLTGLIQTDFHRRRSPTPTYSSSAKSDRHTSPREGYALTGTLVSSSDISLDILTRLYAVATNSQHSPVRSRPT